VKAAILTKKANPITFTEAEISIPIPAEDEMLIQVHASSINAADYRSIQLGVKPESGVYGADFAGVIIQCGKQVAQFKPGDEVFGDLSGSRFGTFAKYVIAKPSETALKPANLNFKEAAALPLASLTALNALRDARKLEPNARVLVYGAGGGVGVYAVQIAKSMGTMITAVCGPGNIDLLASLGADVVLDYTLDDGLTLPGRYDLILAINGNQPITAYLSALAPRGNLIVVGGEYSQIIRTILFRGLLSLGGKKISLLSFKPCKEDLQEIADLAARKVISPVIDRVFPLSDLTRAFVYVKGGHLRGKVVIEIAD
jgi:NADPH:quinone reductase-like Zn-dependent oxidoreductase